MENSSIERYDPEKLTRKRRQSKAAALATLLISYRRVMSRERVARIVGRSHIKFPPSISWCEYIIIIISDLKAFWGIFEMKGLNSIRCRRDSDERRVVS